MLKTSLANRIIFYQKAKRLHFLMNGPSGINSKERFAYFGIGRKVGQ